MIANILRKDIRLLWPLAALANGMNLCSAICHYLRDQLVPPPPSLAQLTPLLSVLSLLGMLVVAVVAMHQDAVPGVRQDWLIRPIWRRDLILAKIAFVLLMIQAPLWLIDFGAALADGIPFPAACVAATVRNFAVLCELSLPAMMVGAITRSFVEAFMLCTAALIGYILFFQVVLAMVLGVKASVPETGAIWMVDAAFYVTASVGAALILPLQYFRRRTLLARSLVGLGGAAILAWTFMPWPLAFAMQRSLAAEPQAARSVQLAFDPRLGRFRLPPGAAPNATNALYIPLKVAGVPEDASVLLDHAEVRITTADGALLYKGKSNISVDGLGSMQDAQFEIRGARSSSDAYIHQRLYLPPAVLARIGDRPVKLGIDYSLTLFRGAAHFAVPAVGAHATIGKLGECVTRVDEEGDDVLVRCLSGRRQPTCLTEDLEDATAGLRNREVHFCIGDYTPAIFGSLLPDGIHRTGVELPFFDRSGSVHYPLDGSKLADSRVEIETLDARDHFMRHVDTPVLQLADLGGQAGGPGRTSTP
ncbi:MAG TPA: hypothetical protein VMF03_17210 [Steroidobacteraceae bacterium]|nr:hypothetical protein [Steroidobacteraceae bacterium]